MECVSLSHIRHARIGNVTFFSVCSSYPSNRLMSSHEELARLRVEVEHLKDNYAFLVNYYRSKIAEKRAERDRLISKCK